MSDSQLWSDAIALCQAITDEDDGRWREVLSKYHHRLVGGAEDIPSKDLYGFEVIEALALLGSSLLEYAAYELGIDVNDVATFILLEQMPSARRSAPSPSLMPRPLSSTSSTSWSFCSASKRFTSVACA